MKDSSEYRMGRTEDIGIFEVDCLGGDWVGRVEQDLSLPVELDGVGGLVDAVGGLDEGSVLDFLHLCPHVLLSHILYVIHRESGTPFQ